jgi:hypothetical protein
MAPTTRNGPDELTKSEAAGKSQQDEIKNLKRKLQESMDATKEQSGRQKKRRASKSVWEVKKTPS